MRFPPRLPSAYARAVLCELRAGGYCLHPVFDRDGRGGGRDRPAELRGQLAKLIADPQLRTECARRSLAVGQKNHRRERTAQWFREQVEAIRPERQR